MQMSDAQKEQIAGIINDVAILYANGHATDFGKAAETVANALRAQADARPDHVAAWMREFFGTESRMYHAAGIGVLMGPKMLAQVKAHV